MHKKSLLIFILFLLIGGALSASLCYEMHWDFFNYHYYNGFAFLNKRLGYDLAPGFQMTFCNPLLDTITYLTATALNTHIHFYSFVMGLFFGTLLYVLFLLNRIFFDSDTPTGKTAIAISMVIGITGFATWFQIGSSTGEIPVSVLTLSGLYILLQHWFVLKDLSPKHLFLAGFLLGSATALKLTAAMYCITCGFCVLIFFRKLPRPARSICYFILGGLAGFLLFNGFWMILLYKEYQNPLFPFFNAIFKSPWFPLVNPRDTIHTSGNTPVSLLMLPLLTIAHSETFPFVGVCTFTDFRFLISFILLIVFFCRSLKKNTSPARDQTKFIFLFALFSYIFWIIFFSIIRYTVPIENVLGILFTLALFSKKSSKIFLPLKIIIFCLLVSTPFLSEPWTSLKMGTTVTNAPDPPDVKENTLILLASQATSSFFVDIAREHPEARAISLYSRPLLYWKTNGSITGYGKFKELRNKIIQEHNGDILAILLPEETSADQDFLFTLQKGACFNASKTFEIDGKKVTKTTSKILFCKIQKKSALLLNTK